MGPLPSAKHKWQIDNALDAKITARVVHNGERAFYIHILWLNNFSGYQKIKMASPTSDLNFATLSSVDLDN